MRTGISTGCLYPMLTEQSIDTLVALGFDVFEIFFNSFSELETDYLDKLRFCLERHHARVVSLHPFTSSFESFLLFSNYERRFLDGVAFYEMYFRAAQHLGASMVILHGLNTEYRSTISDQEYFRRFACLQERAQHYNVTLLQENVAKFRSKSSEFLQRMAEEIPESAAFVCDIKQALRCETDPVEIVWSMGSRLRHLHISDDSADHRCILPGQGCYDYRRLFDCLHELGYNGDLIIEVYRFSFRELSELVQSRRFLEEQLSPYFSGRRSQP